MARGLFITGFTVAEVLAIQRRAKELLLENKTVMNCNDADTSVSKQFMMFVGEVLDECCHALPAAGFGTRHDPVRVRGGFEQDWRHDEAVGDDVSFVFDDPFNDFSFLKFHCFRNGGGEVDVILVGAFLAANELDFGRVSHGGVFLLDEV
jgi:hypothetical protein